MTCTWEPDAACLGDTWEGLDDAIKDRSLLLATQSLQMLTNYRVGLCPITVRPCPEPIPCGCNWEPHLLNGRWLNACGCRTARWCSPLSEVDLEGPVGYISSLKVDGGEIDLSNGDWRLDDGHILVWQGLGTSPIPVTQDLNRPDTALGTWSVTYSKSHAVDQSGKMAVAYLAAEFAKACLPKKECKLPRGVRSVTRSGVSFTIESGMFPGGLTGIDIVDSYILRWAPASSPIRNAVVFDPSERKSRYSSPVPGVGVSGNHVIDGGTF